MLELLREKIESWKRLGVKESTNGSCLFAHIPRDFPEAYLHTFFAPRLATDWGKYEINLTVPLRELYSECNGLSIFHALSIYGIRSHFRRDQSARFEPFDLMAHDKEHRTVWHPLPKGIADTRIFFGSYGWDGSGVCVMAESPKVYRILRKTSVPSNEWRDIKTFLDSEYERINKLFSSEGYLLIEGTPTVPS